MAASISVCSSSTTHDRSLTTAHNAELSVEGEALKSCGGSTHSTHEARVAASVPQCRIFPMMPRPNCTHIVMDYFYTTDVSCDHCSNVPRLGWLYVCQQDHHSEAIAHRRIESLNQITNTDHSHSRIDELRACGMSRSILDQVKQGNIYDPFQIEVLKNQRINMLRVMDQQLSEEEGPWNMSSKQVAEHLSGGKELPALPDDSFSSKMAMRTTVCVAKTAVSKIIQKLDHFRRRSRVIPRCGFKCCHACRPYLRDRAYIPLGGAVVGDVIPQNSMAVEPPVSRVEDVKTLGLRQMYQPRLSASQESDDEVSTGTSITASTESDENVYEVDSYGLDCPPANVSSWPGGSHSSSDGFVSDHQLLRRHSPSYSDKTRDRLAPPGVFATYRSTASGRAIERGPGPDHNADAKQGSASDGMHKTNRGKSSSSQATSAHGHDSRCWGSHHELDNLNHKPHDQERPDSGDVSVESSTRLVEATSGQPVRGRLLERARYYTPGSSTSPNEHESPRSQASGDEVQVDGGVALTEEALETQIPDIITDAGCSFDST